MTKSFFTTVAAAACVAVMLFAPGLISADNGKGNAYGKNKGYPYGANQSSSRAYAIGLWGDLPYSPAQALGIPALLADMNSQDLAFTAHDGDLKAGSNSSCDEALYATSLGYFNSLKAPAIFTPGDNDWTDCDRANNGGWNSRGRLDRERQIFFATPYTLGQTTFLQETQSALLCLGFGSDVDKVACPENRRWVVGRVMYATLNIQGSCNNLCDTLPDPVEFAARNAANIAWMNETFDLASEMDCAGAMLISQANPGWDTFDSGRAPIRDGKSLVESTPDLAHPGQFLPDGFKDFLLALRARVIAFRKPVSYVHGDSHTIRIDKPFLNSAGHRLENFTRVETFGNNAPNGLNDVQWLKVLVDPSSREVFAYQPQIVPLNRTAVPAP